MTAKVSISIVSHGHGEMVAELVDQLLICPSIGQVIITHNVPEKIHFPPDPRISTIVNPAPKGFGANHNAAFQAVTHEWFVVLNPDVTIQGDPFEKMLNEAQVSGGSILAPCARTATGVTDDNWRRFPTVWSLALKAFGGSDGRYATGASASTSFRVEWVSGFCMLIKTEVFAALNGFDERYFMYYEDVDFCARAWRAGFPVLACSNVDMIHNARRASRRNLRHMRWHLASLLRYLISNAGRLPRIENT